MNCDLSVFYTYNGPYFGFGMDAYQGAGMYFIPSDSALGANFQNNPTQPN